MSWLILLGAVVAKYAFDVTGATTALGPIHGVIFLVYLASVLMIRGDLGWTPRETWTAIVAAVIPLGPYLIVERRMLPT